LIGHENQTISVIRLAVTSSTKIQSVEILYFEYFKMVRMLELARSQLPFYSRLPPETDEVQPTEQPNPLQRNLYSKKLLGCCGISIIAVLIIALVVWIFYPTARHANTPTPESTGTNLKFIALVHRHGARSAIYHYEFEEGIHWEVPPGKLLDVGFRNGFKFGQKLRNKYSSEPGSITQASVAAFSTNVDRTIDTVHSVLIELFSPSNTRTGEANCNCRPKEKEHSTEECVAKCIGVAKPSVLPKVTIWNEGSGKEAILRQYDVCEGWGEYLEKLRYSQEVKTATEVTFRDRIKYLAQQIGKISLHRVNVVIHRL